MKLHVLKMQEISESLQSAKNSLSDCKILIQVQLIQVTSNTITFVENIDQDDIKTNKIFVVNNDLDQSGGAHVHALKKVGLKFKRNLFN